MQKRVPIDHSQVKDFALPIGRKSKENRPPLQHISQPVSNTIDSAVCTANKIPRVQNQATSSKVTKKRKPKNTAPHSKYFKSTVSYGRKPYF